MAQVKWIGKDGGWKVGRILPIDYVNPRFCIVEHYHTRVWEVIRSVFLTDYPSRSERGEEAYGSDTIKSEPVDALAEGTMRCGKCQQAFVTQPPYNGQCPRCNKEVVVSQAYSPMSE